MATQLTIEASIEWVREEGGGETCAVCGDTCFISERNCYVRINRTRLETPVASLCNSCEGEADAL